MLTFKNLQKISLNTYCTWEPFSCVKCCHDPEHQRLPSCYNCAIGGDCSKLDGHWQHSILYNCDACAFRDNLAEICEKLRENPENINNIY